MLTQLILPLVMSMSYFSRPLFMYWMESREKPHLLRSDILEVPRIRKSFNSAISDTYGIVLSCYPSIMFVLSAWLKCTQYDSGKWCVGGCLTRATEWMWDGAQRTSAIPRNMNKGSDQK